MKSRLFSAMCAALFTFVAMSSHAALVGRLPLTPGGTDFQAAYDTMLDITWVTNGGLSGARNWDNQVAWVNSLNATN
jgi:hypothetical protein